MEDVAGADSELMLWLFPKEFSSSLQRSPTLVVCRRGPSDDQVRNTILKVSGAKREVKRASLRTWPESFS